MQTTIQIQRDFWGNLKSDATVADPLLLLEEQGALLSQKTGGLVRAKVVVREIKAHEAKTLWNKSFPFLTYSFYILVPPTFHTTTLFWILKPKNEVHYPLTIFDDEADTYYVIETPLEFELKVMEILGRETTKTDIQRMMEKANSQ